MFLNVRFLIAIGIILFWVFIGTILFHYLEDWNYIKSFYFSVTTLTTVGYGDVIPSNDMTRLFTSIYILFGVTFVIGGSMGVIGNHVISNHEGRIKKRIEKKKI